MRLEKLPYTRLRYLLFMVWFFAVLYFCHTTWPEPLGLTIACFIVWITVRSPINGGAFAVFVFVIVPELCRLLEN